MSELPRVLIVDDDHDTLDLLEMFLYKDFEVISAMNGFEALSKVELEHPRIVFTDIKMPVMDGISFLNSLRKHSSTRTLPVVAVTSFMQEHTIKSLLSMGFNGVMAKPPEKKQTLEMVTRLFSPLPAENQQGPDRETVQIQ
jgi:CheY-like chemotaxis protein